ncbi:hypothetical protein M0Q97_09205 [Candidatus Dojkabacteria bacterium]|jgi:hypothetical protein|nr:hypothetical protein [Candidatus Dojkabacteria bacterium]
MKKLAFLILVFLLQACVTIEFNNPNKLNLNNTSWQLINVYTDAPIIFENSASLEFKNDSIYINNESSSYYIKNDKLIFYIDNKINIVDIELSKDSLILSCYCSYCSYGQEEKIIFDENGDYLCIFTFINNNGNQLINNIIGYKTDTYDSYTGEVWYADNISNNAIDNNLSTVIQYNSLHNERIGRYYYDFNENVKLNTINLYLPLNGFKSTIEYIELYYSNNSNGPWNLATHYTFNVKNYNKNTIGTPSWYTIQFPLKYARYWKVEGCIYDHNIYAGFQINEIVFEKK